MTTLEEMDAELRALREQRRELDKSITEKQAAYNLARAEATGLVGHLVEHTVHSWRRPARTQRFVVAGLSNWGGGKTLRGTIVKANGQLGTRQVEGNIADLKDLGVYQPEPSNA